jgi:hypothetical protein
LEKLCVDSGCGHLRGICRFTASMRCLARAQTSSAMSSTVT